MTATKVLSIIFGILLLICGFYIIFNPALGNEMLVIFASIAMMVEGIGSICAYSNEKKMGNADGWTLAGGIISLIIGIILLIGWVAKFIALAIIVYFVIAWLIIVGIIRIAGSLKLRKLIKAAEIKNPKLSWGWMLFVGILCLICGILLIFQPIFMAAFLGIMVGIGVIVAGCSLIATGCTL